MKWRDIDPEAFHCVLHKKKFRECTRKEFPPEFVVNVICQFKDPVRHEDSAACRAPYFVYHVTGMHKDPDPTCKMFTWRCRSDKCAKCADVRPENLQPRS